MCLKPYTSVVEVLYIKNAWLSDPAHSHEMLITYFAVTPLKKVQIGSSEILSAFFVKRTFSCKYQMLS